MKRKINIKCFKSSFLVALCLVTILISNPIQAKADSLLGADITYNVSYGSDYATATTQWYYSGGTRSVNLYYYYAQGNSKYYSYDSSSSSSVVSYVTLYRTIYGYESVGAKSNHRVQYGNYTWGWVSAQSGNPPSSNSGWVKYN